MKVTKKMRKAVFSEFIEDMSARDLIRLTYTFLEAADKKLKSKK